MDAKQARELYFNKIKEPNLNIIFSMIAQRAKLGHVVLGFENISDENIKTLESLGYKIKLGRKNFYYISWL